MSLTAFVLIALQEAREICEGQINVSILSALHPATHPSCGEGCSYFFPVAMIKHSDRKQPEGQKGFFQLIAPQCRHPWGKSRQGLKGRHVCCSTQHYLRPVNSSHSQPRKRCC